MLGSRRLHLFMHNVFDILSDSQTHRQPGKDTGGLAPNVTSPHQPLVAGDFRLRRILAQGPDEEFAQACRHRSRLPALGGDDFRGARGRIGHLSSKTICFLDQRGNNF